MDLKRFRNFRKNAKYNKSIPDWIWTMTKIRTLADKFYRDSIKRNKFEREVKRLFTPLLPQMFYTLTERYLKDCFRDIYPGYDAEIENIVSERQDIITEINEIDELCGLYGLFVTPDNLGLAIFPTFEIRPKEMLAQMQENPFLVLETVSDKTLKRLCEILFF